MELKVIKIEKPDDMNFILGHSHFIKTVEDLYEAIIQGVPGIKFGIAFCEASGKCLVRHTGNDEKLIEIAKKNAWNISAGHTFLIFMENGFPVNILNSVKMVTEVCRVYCATANPTEVILAETEQGRAVLGVVDGFKPQGVEGDEDIAWRKDLLRSLGYKQ
ncbi:MAG: adenosine-specific kinase [Calditrichia bacterium]